MTATRLTQQGTKRRQQLIREASKLFAQGGFYATRVIDIVKSAGVAKGLFYWYFDNKETLFREVIKAARDDLRRAQASAIKDEPDALKRISKGIRASLEFGAANEHLFHLFLSAGKQDQFSKLMEETQAIHADDTAQHIKAAIDAGQIGRGDPTLLGHGVVALMLHFARLYDEGAIHMSDAQFRKFVDDCCLRSIGAYSSVPTKGAKRK